MEPEEDLTKVQYIVEWSAHHPDLNRYIKILYATGYFRQIINNIYNFITTQNKHKNKIVGKIMEMLDEKFTYLILEQKYDIISSIIKQSSYSEFCKMFYNASIYFPIIIKGRDVNELQIELASHFAGINRIYMNLAKKYARDNKYMYITTDSDQQKMVKLSGVIDRQYLLDVDLDINGMYLLSQHPFIRWDHVDEVDFDWDPRGVSRNPNITWDIVVDNPNYPWSYYDLSFNPNINRSIVLNNGSRGWYLQWILDDIDEEEEIAFYNSDEIL